MAQLDGSSAAFSWRDLPCTVRVSLRARKVTLRVRQGPRLEVVVPAGFDQRRVPELLAAKESWISQVVKRLGVPIEPREDSWRLPHEIHLRALDRRITVTLESRACGVIRLAAPDESTLCLSGEVHHEAAGRRILQQWLRAQGRQHLAPWLERLSCETRLSFQRVCIRRQKTRWGSCSNKGTISLNEKLLFLPPQLVRYIMIHELCHTVHLNHSSKFYATVARFEPNWRELDRSLTEAGALVPHWAH